MKTIQSLLKARKLNIVGLLPGIFMTAVLLLPAGCTVMRYIAPQNLPYDKLAGPYNVTQLKKSNTLDVLSAVRAQEYQPDPNALAAHLLSQSDTLVAVSGQSKDLYKTWFSMFVFDEHSMTAQRKYFFCSDEKTTVKPGESKRYIFPPKRTLIFDTQVVLQAEVLAKPYATDEAKQIAILKQIAEYLKSDIQQLGGNKNESAQSNKLLSASSLMMNQTFEGILLQLSESPSLARQLGDAQGIRFGHISLNKGRIRMTLTEDIATVNIRIGLPMQ
jgi:hypothetical protein